MSAPQSPTTPTVGLSQSDFTVGTQANFIVYGSGLSGLTNLTISTTLPGVQWTVSSYTGGTTSVQITATPTSNGGAGVTSRDDVGDMTVSVTNGSGTGTATYSNITYRQP